MKYFLKRLLLFLIIVVVLQLIVRHKVPPEIRLIDKAVSRKVDIVYFCDSTNFAYGLQDTDRRSISQMLQDIMPEREILAIDHGALHMDMYLAFCQYISRSRNRPNALIIPVNMRSFSLGWDQRPNWQFEKERFFLNYPLLRPFFKPLAVFKAVRANEISVEQYNQTGVYCDEELVGTVREFDFMCTDPNAVTDDDIRKKCIFQYMYPLKPDTRKLRSMLQIVKILNSIGVRLILYITPLDMETGQKYLPGRFSDRVGANIQLVKTLLRNQNVEPLDLSQSVSAENFSWTVYPNEHLDQHGRLFVADSLAKALRDNGAP
jgi:hypothetical protein